MRKQFTVNEKFGELFNEVRIKYVGQKLSKTKLVEICKEELGFNLDQDYLKFFIENNILTTEKKGKKRAYYFTYKPVYYQKLQQWWKDICEFRKQRRNKYNTKHTEEQVYEVSVVDPIDEAISLLKSYGYKILKPVNTWEEV